MSGSQTGRIDSHRHARLPRVLQHFGLRSPLTVSAPPGCVSQGGDTFLGITRASDDDVALGHATGVVSGGDNNSCDDYSAILGGFENVLGGYSSETSADSAIVGGIDNSIDASLDGFIGGGAENQLGQISGSGYDASHAAIVGGDSNTVATGYSFIGAGYQNSIAGTTVVADGQSAFIGAGTQNLVTGNFASIVGGGQNVADAPYAFIGGGSNNQLNAGEAAGNAGNASVIGGGANNVVSSTISGGAQYATIGGGRGNHVAATAGTIGGGYSNSVAGAEGTVPGGTSNAALGADSFAAGTASRAAHAGVFVWSDDATSATQLVSNAPNQFLARASGGYVFYSSATLKSGVSLAPGSGSWSNLSDRDVKTGIVPVDASALLAKVEALPLSEWSYTAQGSGIRHIGPMAQDFYASFHVGEDNKHIATVDEDGVALAAIKALSAQVRAQRAELSRKNRELGSLQRRVDALASAVARLTSGTHFSPQ